MDRASMIARFGGDEQLVGELVSLFVAECPRMLQDVRDGVAGGSADAVRKAAHTFKGAVANFTDSGPAVTARELEQMGREGQLTAAPAALERLEFETARLLDVMRAFA
jgi:HPt (histidine-containing phosphotransfer) domain-containing protein